ncbi:MAG: hypothetical protein ACFFKA_11145 [Candidatus Thorarchaeota archaeon]
MTQTMIKSNANSLYRDYLIKSFDLELFQIEPESINVNPQFKSLSRWFYSYLGAATAQLNGVTQNKLLAVRDENRNAIIPEYSTEINNKSFYLSIKGCGAYQDMFFGGKLTIEKLRNTCRSSEALNKLERLTNTNGLIMGESWMAESPYGAQGSKNGLDELEFSKMANLDSINGAYICPAIALVQIPKRIEETARNFFWFRTYQDHFYQVIRLVPSNIRLYFESDNVIAAPNAIFKIFGIDTLKEVEQFEINFIKSGIALLTLFTRSAKLNGNEVTGICYQDVWLDKDCVVAPDGTIHFADIEGFVWKKVTLNDYIHIQTQEWQKLVYEFLFALVQIDSYRHKLENRQLSWSKQREELAFMFYQALNKDFFTYSENLNKNLTIVIEGKDLPSIEIPIIEKVEIL